MERGASYVPLIIVIVLLVVALAWAYIKNDEVDQLAKEIKKAKAEQKAEQDRRVNLSLYLKNLGDKVGFPLENVTEKKPGGSDLDRIDTWMAEKLDNLKQKFTREFPVAIYTFDPNGGIKRDDTAADGRVKVVYIAPASIPSELKLEELYELMEGAMSRMLNDITRLVADVQRERAKFAAREVEFGGTIADKDGEIVRLRNEKSAVEASKAQMERDKNDEIQALENSKREAEENLETAQNRAKDEIAALKNQILALKQDVVKLKQRKQMETFPIGPDGQVLAVTDDQGLAILNRGKSDHLQPGTTFDVYTLGKGAQKIAKGVVTVLEVDSKTAKARVISLLNPMNPIVTGDYFESATYNPETQLHFYLLGRMRKYGKTDAAARLTDLGQAVDSEVGIDTDYLVLGAGENEDDNLRDKDAFKRAQELGIRVITEAQLSTFLDY
jgi:HAMP domain-containing protein